ncbi:MAG: efflux RND transporter periplasmic adaptor subunit [Geminicoccaceae bacterium]
MSILRKLMILPPLAIGAAILAYAISGREPPATVEPAEASVPVRVLIADPGLFVPRVAGFGVVQPARTWQAVAQVAGRIEEVNPDFVRGGTLAAEDVVVRIAEAEYRLAIAQAEAEIESTAAEVEQTSLSRDTLQRSLAIETEALAIAERDLERQRELAERNTVAAATVETEESVVLAQRSKVQDLENQLALLPSSIRALEQRKAVAEASLDIARLDLERTVIRTPFDSRVAEANVEVSQYVGVGTALGRLDGIAAAEIDVQVAPQQMAGFVRLAFGGLEAPVGRAVGQMPPSAGLGATVRVGFPGTGEGWDAEVRRISDTVDPDTRSIGVIVAVDRPYEQAIPGVRPPLIKGMFTEVELYAPAVSDVILVPRDAVRNGRVMIADDDDRLAFREVTVAYRYEDIAVISDGIEPGARVVISDPTPAIEGMLLAPKVDEEAVARIDLVSEPKASSASTGE